MWQVLRHKQQALGAAAHESLHPLESLRRFSRLTAQLGDEKTHQNSKRKWFDEKQKRLKEELERRGLTEKEKHRLETAEVRNITPTLVWTRLQ
jgi:ribosome assembly protein YihI (activator of Der GTPase)